MIFIRLERGAQGMNGAAVSAAQVLALAVVGGSLS